MFNDDDHCDDCGAPFGCPHLAHCKSLAAVLTRAIAERTHEPTEDEIIDASVSFICDTRFGGG
jgi:hypothetical protein